MTILPIGERVYFTANTAIQAQKSLFCLTHASHFVEIGGASVKGYSLQPPFSILFSFCEYMQDTFGRHSLQRIIICPEDTKQLSIATACLLCGVYLLLCESKGLEEVLVEFGSTLNSLTPDSSEFPESDKCIAASIRDCWRALDRARDLHWVGVSDETSELIFDVEMAMHYARPSNGRVRVLVPGKLLLFPAPALLPAGQEWAQVSPTTRAFSAGFLANLLAHLGVSAVACFGQTDGRDAAAFAARGLDVHDLGLDPRRPALLRAVDQLLSVCRACPGPVALFGGGGDGEPLPELVEILAAAYMVVERGFGAAPAAAWMRMLCPACNVVPSLE